MLIYLCGYWLELSINPVSKNASKLVGLIGGGIMNLDTAWHGGSV
jgi:hypothetical protein